MTVIDNVRAMQENNAAFSAKLSALKLDDFSQAPQKINTRNKKDGRKWRERKGGVLSS